MVARPVLERTKFLTITMTSRRKMKALTHEVSFGMPIIPSAALHLGEGEDGVRVDHEGLHDDGEPQRGDAEIVAAQGENGKAEEEADFRGESPRKDHGEEEHDLLRSGEARSPGAACGAETAGAWPTARARPTKTAD